MTKVLFLLSAVVMVIASFFAYQNQQTFIQTRNNRIETVNKINGQFKTLSTVSDENLELKAKVGAVSTETSTENDRLDQLKIKMRNIQAESDRAGKEIDENQAKIADYKQKLNELPVGVSPETINEDINKIKAAIADNETKATAMKEQVTAKQDGLKKVESQLSDVVRRIDDRKKFFVNNSMTATLVAVNQDWGFVVINAGQDKGITTDTKLLVTRGQQTIGKLNIIAVDGNKTVANIVQDSLLSGLSMAPGDKVILESLYQ